MLSVLLQIIAENTSNKEDIIHRRRGRKGQYNFIISFSLTSSCVLNTHYNCSICSKCSFSPYLHLEIESVERVGNSVFPKKCKYKPPSTCSVFIRISSNDPFLSLLMFEILIENPEGCGSLFQLITYFFD